MAQRFGFIGDHDHASDSPSSSESDGGEMDASLPNLRAEVHETKRSHQTVVQRRLDDDESSDHLSGSRRRPAPVAPVATTPPPSPPPSVPVPVSQLRRTAPYTAHTAPRAAPVPTRPKAHTTKTKTATTTTTAPVTTVVVDDTRSIGSGSSSSSSSSRHRRERPVPPPPASPVPMAPWSPSPPLPPLPPPSHTSDVPVPRSKDRRRKSRSRSRGHRRRERRGRRRSPSTSYTESSDYTTDDEHDKRKPSSRPRSRSRGRTSEVAPPPPAPSVPLTRREPVPTPGTSVVPPVSLLATTAPMGQTLLTHAQDSMREVKYMMQTFSDHGPVWGSMSRLYHCAERVHHKSPPTFHHPIIMSAYSYVTLQVELSYFSIPAANAHDRSALPGPVGSTRFTLQCSPHLFGAAGPKEYRCVLSSARGSGAGANVRQVSPGHTVMMSDEVIVDAEVFPNTHDVLSMSDQVESPSTIYYLDIKVGYKPRSLHLSDGPTRTFGSDDESSHEWHSKQREANHMMRSFRLYWTAHVHATYNHL